MEDAEYLAEAIATLAWIIDPSAGTPISGIHDPAPSTRDLKAERLRAEDAIVQREMPEPDSLSSSRRYALAVNRAIDWLLGDTTLLS